VHKHEALPIEEFLATVLPKLCLQVKLKKIVKNKKLGYFVVKAIRSRDVP